MVYFKAHSKELNERFPGYELEMNFNSEWHLHVLSIYRLSVVFLRISLHLYHQARKDRTFQELSQFSGQFLPQEHCEHVLQDLAFVATGDFDCSPAAVSMGLR